MSDKKQPTIIQFEPEEFYHAVVDQMLFGVGLEVGHWARTKAEAGKLVQQIERQEIKPDVAIIDTLLEKNHHEGRVIATKLKEILPQIKIIAYTIVEKEPAGEDVTEDWTREHDWADYVAIKSNRSPTQTIAKGLSDILGVNLDEKQKDPEFEAR